MLGKALTRGAFGTLLGGLCGFTSTFAAEDATPPPTTTTPAAADKTITSSGDAIRPPSAVGIIVADDAGLKDLQRDKTWGTIWDSDWDRPKQRGFPTLGKGERQVVLIRHGQYQNENGKDDSVKTLTTLGQEQARLTGKFLKENMKESYLFVDSHVSWFYSSTMTRAKQTAKLIAEEMNYKKPVLEDSLLREAYPCDPQPPLEGVKASRDSADKAEQAFTKYIHRPNIVNSQSTDVVVGHGNIIRYFACRGIQVPPEAWLRIWLAHCSITSLKIKADGTVKLTMLGAVTHLPGEKQTMLNLPDEE